MDKTDMDAVFMRRCLQLASLGRGHVSPNPMVGAVVVHRGRIIGEGYHRCYGQPHAEVNAINSVRDAGLLPECTLSVPLEPCSHYGKTPPCADLIVQKKIPRVVVGCLDPFPKVSGQGVARLREAGIEVVTGVLEEECKALNRTFMTCQIDERPFVTLKWAQSRDGYIDRIRKPGEPAIRISDDVSSVWVHRLRAEADAILVGTNTAVADNPSLTTRLWYGRSPLRIVLDEHARVPSGSHVFTDGLPSLVITAKDTVYPVLPDSVEVIRLPFGKDLIPGLLNELYRRRIQHLLVEGGAVLLQSFLDSEYWDETRVETGPMFLGNGVAAPVVKGMLVCSEYCGKAKIDWYENR